MDPMDSVRFLAAAESKHMRPEIAVDKSRPYIEIRRDQLGKYMVRGNMYEHHENGGRMPFLCDYMSTKILPNVQTDVCGTFNVVLNDSYTYLPDRHSHVNTLTFSRDVNDHNVCLIPDEYQMIDYAHMQVVKDDLPWKAKRDMVAGFFTTTGSRIPCENARLSACMWSFQHRDVSDLYVTKVAQMDERMFEAYVAGFKGIKRPPVPPSEVYSYKLGLSIDGNTCAWDRVPLIMRSNTLLVKEPSPNICFYYPLFHAGTHFVHSEVRDLEKVVHYYNNNEREARLITHAANRFAETFLNGNVASVYMTSLLEAISERRR
jgi:Glycosyl transferase family 90